MPSLCAKPGAASVLLPANNEESVVQDDWERCVKCTSEFGPANVCMC